MSTKHKSASNRRKAHEGRIRIELSDFGPIARGEMDLRPLTVFAGPSNTGKSWLATLIYVFERHFNGDSLGKFGFASRRRLERHRKKPTAFPESPEAWMESIKNDEAALPLTDSDKEVVASVLEGGREELGDELMRCFGLSELGHLVREHGRSSARVTIVDDNATRSPAVRYDCKITQDGKLSLDAKMPDHWHLPFDPHPEAKQWFLEELDDHIRDKDARFEDRLFLFPGRSFHLLSEAAYNGYGFYLPADRGGVMHAHHVVVSALIQNASRAGLGRGSRRGSPLPALSGVLTDFLQNLLEVAGGTHGRDIGRLHRRKGKPDDDRAARLETNVLNGRIRVEKSSVDYPHFTYRPDGSKRALSLGGVSSMVSELAPVALYLRHHVREGDLLILEEPEAHLHPAIQVAFVREIAEWVRRGIRVILTTHSEWVLEELANIVATGESDSSGGLPNEAVGLWLFETIDAENPHKGSTVREVPWHRDEGGFESGFEDVAMALHNKWADLARGYE